ncbi:MAG: hypothetical protein KMY55_07120 [Dethiosulfatibacter sp.]|nr:hypothetical protein [Dethiosulfatibacter sp.]
MHNSNNTQKSNMTLRVFMSSIVITFGLYIMIFPVLKPILGLGQIMDGTKSWVALVILIFLFLPNIIYSIVAIKTKKLEYVIIPALALIGAEYYFFHNYQTWIASNANAAIALVIIPIYLMLILAISYGIAFVVVKIRRV